MIIICIIGVHWSIAKLIMRNCQFRTMMNSAQVSEIGSTIASDGDQISIASSKSKSRHRIRRRWWPMLSEFKPSEQIVLRSARRLAAIHASVPLQPSDMDHMREEIINAVGLGFGASLAICEGRRAAEELEKVLRTFCCAGYRPLKLEPICEYTVCPDERFLLSFIAGCQRDDLHNVRSILSWLAPSVSASHLLSPGEAFANILKNSSVILPQRLFLSGNACQVWPFLSGNEPVHYKH